MMRLTGQRKKSTKVVLDTNVLISAILFKGRIASIFNLIKTDRIKPHFTETTFLEFQTILRYPKFKPKLEEFSLTKEEIVQAVAEKSIILSDPDNIPEVINEDPSDNHVLACAISCGAFCIVSGDKHLLKLKKFQGISILTPRQFLNRLKW